ncbi:MAG: hypothetical protein ABIJ21_03585 [Nanoarchaeota archaeon]
MSKQWFLTGIIFSMYISFCSADVYISEVMYNPPGPDNMKEWVEITGTDNLSRQVIGDGFINDTLVLINFVEGNYSLVVEDGFDATSVNCSVYAAGPIIVQGLRNDGGMLELWQDDLLLDEMEYVPDFANGNGHSIVRTMEGVVRESSEIGGSPCRIDPETAPDEPPVGGYDLSLSVALPEQVFLLSNQTSLFKILNKDHETGMQENITVFVDFEVCKANGSGCVHEGFFDAAISSSVSAHTGWFIPDVEGNFTLCGKIRTASSPDPDQANNIACKNFSAVNASQIPCNASLDLLVEKDVFVSGEQIAFWNVLGETGFPYELSYSITRSDGTEIKNITTANQAKKTYTPRIDGSLEAFIIENRIAKIACDNQENRTSNRRIVLVRNDVSQRNMSEITILSTGAGSDGIAFFGERISPRIRVYKGNTLKKSVSVLIEGEKRISEPISFSLDAKYTEVTVSLPLNLVDSCTLPEGTYRLIVEGLDARAEEEIAVQQKACTSTLKQEQEKEIDASVQEEDSILSFYTLTKRFDAGQEVKLFGRVDASRYLVLVLENKNAGRVAFVEEFTVQQAEEPVKLTFNVTVLPGENIFSLAVKGVPGSRKEVVMTTDAPLEEENAYAPLVSTAAFLNNSPVFAMNRTFEEGTGTGKVIYEKGPVKYLNTLLVIVFVLAGLVVWRERKKHCAKGRQKGIARKGIHTRAGHVRGLGKPQGARRIVAQGVSQADKGRDPDQGDL